MAVTEFLCAVIPKCLPLHQPYPLISAFHGIIVTNSFRELGQEHHLTDKVSHHGYDRYYPLFLERWRHDEVEVKSRTEKMIEPHV
jgi:hypothetical protein